MPGAAVRGLEAVLSPQILIWGGATSRCRRLWFWCEFVDERGQDRPEMDQLEWRRAGADTWEEASGQAID